jgi:hypothetical protein
MIPLTSLDTLTGDLDEVVPTLGITATAPRVVGERRMHDFMSQDAGQLRRIQCVYEIRVEEQRHPSVAMVAIELRGRAPRRNSNVPKKG